MGRWRRGERDRTNLLYMVDLIVLALLVAGDLPLGLVHQVTDAPQLCALSDRIFHGLCERQAGLPYPLIQASVDCADQVR